MEQILFRQKLIIILAFLCMGLMFLIQEMLLFGLSVQGRMYAIMEENIRVLQMENSELEAQILQNTSYTTLSEKAKSAGFVPAEYIDLH